MNKIINLIKKCMKKGIEVIEQNNIPAETVQIKPSIAEISMSPIPVKRPEPAKPEELDFYSALSEVVAGKKITKLEWCNKEVYGYLKEERLTLKKDDGKDYHWILSEADIKGSDWVII